MKKNACIKVLNYRIFLWFGNNFGVAFGEQAIGEGLIHPPHFPQNIRQCVRVIINTQSFDNNDAHQWRRRQVIFPGRAKERRVILGRAQTRRISHDRAEIVREWTRTVALAIWTSPKTLTLRARYFCKKKKIVYVYSVLRFFLYAPLSLGDQEF